MKRLDPETIDYYNSEIVPMIAEKYGYSQMDALRVFVSSKTHEMLENEDCGLTTFGAGAVGELWGPDMVTGEPRPAVYFGGE